MPEKITAKQFAACPAADQRRYVQEMLHLEYYGHLDPDCDPEEAAEGKRFIASVNKAVLANGSFRYYIRPVNCFDEDSVFWQRGLFSDFNRDLLVTKNEMENWLAAAQACETVNSKGWAAKMVSCEYHGTDNDSRPLQISGMRCLECTPEEMKKRIADIVRQHTQLTSGLARLTQEVQAEQEKIERLRQDWEVKAGMLEAECRAWEDALDEAVARLDETRQSQQEAAGQLERTRAAAKALEAKARSFAEGVNALGGELDLEALGLSLPAGEEAQPPAKAESIEDLRGFARQVRDDLSRKDGLDYEEHVIREFLGAMRTNQIIILSGPPGTGKSSLPQAIAKYIGAECRMVSVQPSWTDNQDLLGFYDPTRERFAATPFMDILADAAQEAEKQSGVRYLVCLDEMNLVRVEYYFSELLSAMETEDKTLRLYSPFAYRQRREALEKKLAALNRRVSEGDQTAVDEQLAASAALKVLRRYPATFRVPDNVRFAGTLNMDESTKDLSPKVLDRSFIIDIRRPDGTGGPEETPPEETLEQRLRRLGELQAGLRALENEHSQQVRAALSFRGLARSEALLSQGLDLDDVFLGKILPALRYTDLEEENWTSLLQMLEKHRTWLKKGLDKLEKIHDKSPRELNYWG